MLLSECMAIGAQRKPQTEEYYFKLDENTRDIVASCALGAALDGAGFNFDGNSDIDIFLFEHFPELFEDEDWESKSSLFDEIVKRNDSGESRESIAADLASRGL